MSIMQTFWMGNLSTLEQTCLNSFVKNGHTVHLYTYDDLIVPEGVVVCDAQLILPRDKVFMFENSLAAFSDMFRYKLLLDKGNYWIDADVLCLKYFDFNDKYVFASEYLDKNYNSQTTTSCIIKAPKNDKMMQENYEYCERINKSNLFWGQIGPALLHKTVIKYNLQNFVHSAHSFCPLYHHECKDFVSPHKVIDVKQSYCVHLWNEMWKRNNINKDGQYDSDCFYEQMKRAYYAR